MKIEDCEHEVTPFSTYAEAYAARDTALGGHAEVAAGVISVERGHYFVTLSDGKRSWYL